ncbi:AUXIN-INDUCED PROTEIN-LIKE-RELATED [Salix viminalis]|uniref:AUXIN-INDUCED PROTEIN-LIKE-RELATED n=1 Tax=Salix viminalis TaxID=40686 RepID=A0A9Q0NLU6_SALVM|nr:AUXIN-INDUCED PROTEIN-LIKE-RELATED [Salix viminalis]
MDAVKDTKRKKSLFLRGWYRSITIGREKQSKKSVSSFTKSKSWHCTMKPADEDDEMSTNNKSKKKTRQVAPDGCFSVYVGPEKQKFAVKAEFANHQLFKMLLEDAELEYGHNSEGPILLPCDVGFFYKVLAEMESDEVDDILINPPSCSSLALCSPARRFNSKKDGYGAYTILTPSRTLELS